MQLKVLLKQKGEISYLILTYNLMWACLFLHISRFCWREMMLLNWEASKQTRRSSDLLCMCSGNPTLFKPKCWTGSPAYPISLFLGCVAIFFLCPQPGNLRNTKAKSTSHFPQVCPFIGLLLGAPFFPGAWGPALDCDHGQVEKRLGLEMSTGSSSKLWIGNE